MRTSIPFKRYTPDKGEIHLKTVTRFTYFLLCLSLAAFSLIVPAAADSDASNIQQAIDVAVKAVKPALVRIRVVSVDDREGREIKEEAVGSGVIISPDGYTVTNHHVAGHATRITCTMSDKSEIDAKLIGTDPATDIAVIKLISKDNKPFATAKFGDSAKLRVGERVLAMGSPLAFSQSVTMGIVSNTELVIPGMMGDLTLDGEDVGALVRWIAHDAEIHPGNSGGPLVNMSGKIIGINEIELGLGGAIPGNLARDIAEILIKNGKVKRGWLGVTTQPLFKSTSYKSGVLVGGVVDGSPAQKAGFKPGDIMIRLAGKDCSVRFAEELPAFNQLVAGLTPGKEIDAVLIRDGKEITLKCTPADKEDARPEPKEFKEWGLCGGNLNKTIAKKRMKAEPTGVFVTSVRPGGPAGEAKPDIDGGDIIISVAGKPVNNIDDLRKVTQEITSGKSEPVPTIVTFERKSNQYITVVKVGMQDLIDPGLEVRKAWLPVNTQVLTRDIAEAMSLQDRTGVRITKVYPKSTAETAGLKVGDIIVALDGTAIPASEPEDTEVFPTMVRQYKIGSTAKLTVIRDGKELAIDTSLPQSPVQAREMKKYLDESFDFTVRELSFFDRVDRNWADSQTGVLVESVGEGGWASLGGLLNGDLITMVDGKSVTDVASFQMVMQNIATTKPKTIVFQVKQGMSTRFVEIEPSWVLK